MAKFNKSNKTAFSRSSIRYPLKFFPYASGKLKDKRKY